MNEFSLKNKIFERAFALGFSACGITPVKEVDADCRLHFDKWLQKGKEARMQYMRNYKDKRFDPRLFVRERSFCACSSLELLSLYTHS